ncbi:PTS sugar transporter subunit IIA [Fontisphaera persica]|uniref:PTS sugar transporter subunit IIA n=1 Tax=Fontisphaera persica TaxID=2974023 RepID=UPI0024BFADFF|nr:PTS sugar transporter subunit IIA [Fontisphaera persica]WCJ59928.1 PTS sugar transporter subunit IIA [Fontisphaera persica]
MTSSSPQAVRLAELLSPATILLNLRAQDRETVLRELAETATRVLEKPHLTEGLFQALRERELLYSTGIGDGVALPHSRTVPAELATRPLLVFGRHATGIHFHAIDHRPVQIFFLMLASNAGQHLYLLARLSRVLRQASAREALLKATRAEEIIGAVREGESLLP